MRGEGFTVEVQVKPKSSREGIEVRDDGSLVVRVKTPPVEGKANERLIELLSQHFKVPKSCISIIRGHKSRKKLVHVKADR